MIVKNSVKITSWKLWALCKIKTRFKWTLQPHSKVDLQYNMIKG